MTQATKSSDNVFADLGLDNPEELLAKAKLALEISRILESRKLTQAKAAEILGVDPAKVSALVRGRLTGFSTDRLLRFLVALGHDVEIKVKLKRPSRRGARIKVEAA